MSESGRETTIGAGSIRPIVITSSALLLGWALVEPAGLFVVDSPVLFEARYVVGYVTVVPCCIGMIRMARNLERDEIPVEFHSSIGRYWVLGASGFLAFNVALMTFFPMESPWLVSSWLRWPVALGGAVGLFVGVSQTHSIVNTLRAERQSLRAQHMETQRDLIDHLNGILRHEVLNSTQVIIGTAGSIQDADEPVEPTDERIERIHRHGEELTAVIQEVKALLNATQSDRDLRPVDLADVLRREAETIREDHPEVDLELRVDDDDVCVRGDELFDRIFGSLFRNAVEHNDTGSLRISVVVETTAQSAVVSVSDDGDGIPERKLETLFDRPQTTDNGLGLYLVAELVGSYRGTIDLVATGNEGTTFEIAFPLADGDPGANPDPDPETDSSVNAERQV
jgi:two-component system OmpR family sensor kinase